VNEERKVMKKISIALSILLALGLVLVSGCSLQSASAGPLTVKTAAAKQESLDTQISVAGVLVPVQTVSVAAKLSGSATAVNVDVGSVVNAGDVLITLDQKTLNTQMQSAQAALIAAQAQATAAASSAKASKSGASAARGNASAAKIARDAAQAAYDALQKATPPDPVAIEAAKVKLDIAKAQYSAASGTSGQASNGANAATSSIDAANAGVTVAEANIELLQIQLDNTSITAPISGVVVTRSINTGEMAAAGSPLFTIADVSTLKLRGTVPQEALPQLSQGQSMTVSVDIYPGKTYEGKITLIAPMAVATGEYFPIEISLPNDGTLKAGLSAQAVVQAKADAAVAVPTAAIVKGNGQSYVYVIQDGKAVKKVVVTGLTGGGDTEILSGLAVGDQVAVSNVAVLTDGMPVAAQAQ